MNSSPKKTIFITKDGSPTLFLPEHNEHYHSIHGAVTESKHVFMKMGLEKIQDSRLKIQNSAFDKLSLTNEGLTISILEIGFGTGLNAFLVNVNAKANCDYTSIEAFPLEKEEWSAINYANNDEEKSVFEELHRAEWNAKIQLSQDFSLTKLETTLEKYSPAEESFDLIFFDAFSPRVQPELWTEEVFRKMFLCLRKNGILVTYCAKGQVRRNMKAAGFEVERTEGPPGKREMLRAFKI
ncbi:MAG: tRNA (5-methylaminomethyl-2-thiouridine)(34)-methyltransferase MnmD [Bacteroidetes bacterium]|nr:tRNA (5-methylaminomethyl-2-thiouridine)(34)-methyltransferase MnmD [Bacteroidota bacterium]